MQVIMSRTMTWVRHVAHVGVGGQMHIGLCVGTLKRGHFEDLAVMGGKQ
jgi:hypothetical protein